MWELQCSGSVAGSAGQPRGRQGLPAGWHARRTALALQTSRADALLLLAQAALGDSCEPGTRLRLGHLRTQRSVVDCHILYILYPHLTTMLLPVPMLPMRVRRLKKVCNCKHSSKALGFGRPHASLHGAHTVAPTISPQLPWPFQGSCSFSIRQMAAPVGPPVCSSEQTTYIIQSLL